MKVVSGSPLLVQSRIQALGQWRYQPTLLNGQPVAVDLLVTLHFTLDQAS
ncbi:MAG TPA: energy transducer TonB [Candidatus Acidoferrum sp.]